MTIKRYRFNIRLNDPIYCFQAALKGLEDMSKKSTSMDDSYNNPEDSMSSDLGGGGVG